MARGRQTAQERCLRARLASTKIRHMTPLRWLAAVALFLELPVPLYWFLVHPKWIFWRKNLRAVFTIGFVVPWGSTAVFLMVFREALFARTTPPVWAVLIGLVLIFADGWLLMRAKRDLGAARLSGKTELEGGGELASSGIYARMRHPRYVGMIGAVLGACLLAGTPLMWEVAAIWVCLAVLAIRLEERELRRRFGAAYEEYSRRVPRFIPLPLRPRVGKQGTVF